jgi:hypothetical protein
MHTKWWLSVTLTTLLTGSPVFGQVRWSPAQTCDPGMPATAPATQFKPDEAGSVTDRRTGVIWMRCALGQKWTGADCTGTPLTFPWAGAFDAADALNRRGGYGGHADWRVPTLDELASLVEHRCYDPALNLEIFPSSPVTGYWSASPHASHNHAMLIHFKYGGQYMGNKNQDWALRLVRD